MARVAISGWKDQPMTDIDSSIIGSPRSWSRPDDVARREREMRDGIAEFRKQEQQDRARTQELSKSILHPQPAAVLTPEPPEKPQGFAETYALYAPGNFMWGDSGGQDDDGSGA